MKDVRSEKIPKWEDCAYPPISVMKLGTGIELSLYWGSEGGWFASLKVDDSWFFQHRELTAIDQDQRDSAKRLTLMIASTHLSNRAMRLLDASTVTSAILEKMVSSGVEKLKVQGVIST